MRKDKSYNKFDLKDRFCNNRIKGSILNQYMSVVTPVTLQKPLTSMTTSRKPLSQMIKDDQLKNDIKLQKKAIIARKEQQEKQYK